MAWQTSQYILTKLNPNHMQRWRGCRCSRKESDIPFCIEVGYHFIHDCVAWKKLSMEKLSMVDNVSVTMKKSFMMDWFHTYGLGVDSRVSWQEPQHISTRNHTNSLYTLYFVYPRYGGVLNMVYNDCINANHCFTTHL